MNRNALIEDNMKLVYFILNKYYPTFSNNEDLIQCGMIGLCNAARIWDESKSAFSTYAGLAILNEIRRELNKMSKRIPTFSLNQFVSETEEEVDYLNIVVDEKSEDFIDEFNFDLFCETLTEREKIVCDGLRNGLSYSQIGEMIGCTKQNITDMKRKIKIKWRKFNEDSN